MIKTDFFFITRPFSLKVFRNAKFLCCANDSQKPFSLLPLPSNFRQALNTKHKKQLCRVAFLIFRIYFFVYEYR